MKYAFLVFICLLFIGKASAQKDHKSSQKGEGAAGIGLGLPYGGIGVRMGVNAAEGTNLFVGVGYQLAGIGYNFGIRQDFESSKMTQFYLAGMYGSNAAIKVIGTTGVTKLYFGPSFGFGVKVNSSSKEGNHWDIGLLAPVRSSKFKEAERTVKSNSFITDYRSPSPILIVIGYNFGL